MSQKEESFWNDKDCILLAAGGTGGHLLPAQMVGLDLLEKNKRVVFAAAHLEENKIFDRSRFEFYEIDSATLTIRNPLRLARSIFLLLKGFYQSLRLLALLKPRVVVGFGSYHSFPLLLAGWCKKIPIIIFQPDRSLGRANRFFAKKAKVLALQFPLEGKNLKNVSYVPLLPWRLPEELLSQKEARKQLLLQEDLFTLLIYGGSQGAHAINRTIISTIEMLVEHRVDFQVIHLTGEDPKEIMGFYKKFSFPFIVKAFEKNMIPYLKAADLAVCRSGASTIGELISFDLPSILIPYPYARGHQLVNARYMEEEVQGGEVLLQEKMTPLALYQRICQKKESLAYHKEKIKEYKKSRVSLGTKTLCEIICEA